MARPPMAPQPSVLAQPGVQGARPDTARRVTVRAPVPASQIVATRRVYRAWGQAVDRALWKAARDAAGS